MSTTRVIDVENLTGGIPDSLVLGQGQTWQDVAASRVAGTTYTNTTGRPIAVSIRETGDGTRTLSVNGVIVSYAAGNAYDSMLFAVVPAGSTYVFSGGFNIWAELRT